ncbi:hypothetical protein LK07_16165 [Streptomyces pluripotens]|uniref:Uncharacterized protein n=1 Tax=Streptomyces pluripotens TaxID=1355015 RepID=A0A221NZI7_9ACTN|nr:hypothetical protein LK06_015030 [Streptomyces pluripotens]ASN25304.1 hypothetical protein LK07_16165 [Streptomyces pluripotens]KIE25941.1 hypothetical protein LK08_16060 [Streptomyces sp. MUSC 125]
MGAGVWAGAAEACEDVAAGVGVAAGVVTEPGGVLGAGASEGVPAVTEAPEEAEGRGASDREWALDDF